MEILEPAPDSELVRQATELFQARKDQNFDGFEVWDGKRFIYRQERDVSSGKWIDRLRSLLCVTIFWCWHPTGFRTVTPA